MLQNQKIFYPEVEYFLMSLLKMAHEETLYYKEVRAFIQKNILKNKGSYCKPFRFVVQFLK